MSRAAEGEGLDVGGVEGERLFDELFGLADERLALCRAQRIGPVGIDLRVLGGARGKPLIDGCSFVEATQKAIGAPQHHPALEVVRFALELLGERLHHLFDLLRGDLVGVVSRHLGGVHPGWIPQHQVEERRACRHQQAEHDPEGFRGLGDRTGGDRLALREGTCFELVPGLLVLGGVDLAFLAFRIEGGELFAQGGQGSLGLDVGVRCRGFLDAEAEQRRQDDQKRADEQGAGGKKECGH